ncbi:adenine phosphoribosyltransferase [Viridibacillus sp. YIM B01967]|uniref:Adenine phosphoribosyltransferase n=1 Tax=Viridibacillus soli TaxID=2798301 RepID=A0ABS1H9Z4_9BACL|nr:phosphoribosyltransferase family protein [Viridibacillus soli]MBK3496228.1 adenine phosphoribosyltransferase [Viridibacillus soli]
MKTYELHVAGLKRHLPIIQIKRNLSIASFIILGDTEMVDTTAVALAKKLPDIDVIITAEAKGIPLAYELSKQMNLPRYVVARKSLKSYMNDPLIHEVQSITTEEKQILCLDFQDMAFIKYKRVAIIDDIISTGESIKILEELVSKAGGRVIAKAAILAEGAAAERDDIIFLAELPLFVHEQ